MVVLAQDQLGAIEAISIVLNILLEEESEISKKAFHCHVLVD